MLKRTYLLHATLASVITVAAGCGSAPPASSPATPAPSASAPAMSPSVPAATPPATGSGPRLAARDPALEQWKRLAAERIHTANSNQLFEGRPHHLLQGVIVVDVTVDKNGQVTRSRIVRSPGIAKLNNMVQASLKTASPLPVPPAALLKTGAMTYSETWLFTDDSKWRLRTLTMPQE
ncbi:MAG: TonB family protein [Burkholderiaceae bacterium]